MAHAAVRLALTMFVNHPWQRRFFDSGMSRTGTDWEKSIGLKRLCRPVIELTLFRALDRILVNGVYMLENSPSFSTCPKLARIVLAIPSPGNRAAAAIYGVRGTGDAEADVARYRKLGGSLEQSARSAQRGLLVILATALVWLLAIWAGYHLF